MKARVTRRDKILVDMNNRIENLEKVIMAILLRLDKMEEEKKVNKE
jgi:hypothetical protein